ncbi:hypothetical protein IFJ82_09600 [Novacetimonas hansenii]|uniref:hypothetical protein n=1 Tax=Novacetimonas hansenii TaxID=436 RepID=UPI0017859857|nr:hypothetical protein [Novacetimonas hansenii]QOF94206.1 hypothetical protein IFJ82_09600 [Novacetimonas hansenii]
MSNETITDTKGRKIEVKEVAGSRLARLTRIAGDAFGENAWTTGTLARATVLSIEGVPCPPAPQNLNELDGLWDSVDADAASAALEWLIAKQKAMATDAKNSSAPQASSNAAGS